MTFLALVAVFQNNDETLRMLRMIDGIEDELGIIGMGRSVQTAPNYGRVISMAYIYKE